MAGRRALTEQDRQVWAHFARHIAPRSSAALPPALPSMRPAPPASSHQSAPPRDKPTFPHRAPRAGPTPLEVGSAPAGVDRATWSRFRAGQVATERTLDLHGRTLARAHVDLNGFLAKAAVDGVRCVEIITGRGNLGIGAIRRELPLWLNDPALRPLVLAATHPHAANPGSVRLLLRRRR